MVCMVYIVVVWDIQWAVSECYSTVYCCLKIPSGEVFLYTATLFVILLYSALGSTLLVTE